jgi:proteasome assembly chaperone (PAC2) family protein
MNENLILWEKPQADEIYMLAGWRQWADAGSISSGLPRYVSRKYKSTQIGEIQAGGFYLFQFPGTHDLVRPVVRFRKGYPVALDTPRNEIFYTGDDERGLVIFIGDEPHLDVEGYTAAFLDIAETLGVKRIISFGGVYGELPYEKERLVSASYSRPELEDELSKLQLTFSDYHGGASIGAYICKRAGEREIDYVGLYSFVPTYEFSNISQLGSSIRIERDYMAWLAILKRVRYMLKLDLDLRGLERESRRLIKQMDEKVDEIDSANPQLGVREYIQRISEEYTEKPFDPLADVWEEELKRLVDKFEPDDEELDSPT